MRRGGDRRCRLRRLVRRAIEQRDGSSGRRQRRFRRGGGALPREADARIRRARHGTLRQGTAKDIERRAGDVLNQLA